MWILNRKWLVLRLLLPTLCLYMHKTSNEVIVVLCCWFFFFSCAHLHFGSMNMSDVWNRWNQIVAFMNERLHGELRALSHHFNSFIHSFFFVQQLQGLWRSMKPRKIKSLRKPRGSTSVAAAHVPPQWSKHQRVHASQPITAQKQRLLVPKGSHFFLSFFSPIAVMIFWRDILQFHPVVFKCKYTAKQTQRTHWCRFNYLRSSVIRKWNAQEDFSNEVQSLLVVDVSQLGNQERLLLISLLMATKWF